jgi:hypothetical protein
MTRAAFNVHVGQLKSDWEVSSQLALQDGTPYARTFSSLEFTNNDDDRLDLVDLGRFEEEYAGTNYYQLLTKFTEHEFYSSNTETHDYFRKWEYSRNRFYLAISFTGEKIGEVRWDRPYDILQVSGLRSTNPSCPIAMPAVDPGIDPLTTGRPPGFQVGSTVVTPEADPPGPPPPGGFNRNPANDTLTITCKQWGNLPVPYSIQVFGGKAVAAQVTSDHPFTILMKSSPTDTNGVPVSGLITLHKPYLQITWPGPTSTAPTNAKVEFFGKEVSRVVQPAEMDQEPEILVHPATVTGSALWLPPGQSGLMSNFWNTGVPPKYMENYNGREGQNFSLT